MKAILLTTVKHTGTQSLQKLLGECTLQHCCLKMFDDIDKWDEIVTTYRDPYRTAASWANRNLFQDHEHVMKRTWVRQWDNWIKVLPLAKVYKTEELPDRLNTAEDVKGVHKALSEGDMDTYYKHIPKDYLDYVLNLTAEVQRAKFVVTRAGYQNE